jgi:Rrf2 family cysteine metabolism transcriptional repressor
VIYLKLSTKGIYGLIAMLDLASYYSEGPVPLKRIADKQNISESYLEQLFALLRKAGLVKSVRGAQGGYLITDNPDRITVGSILRALEGSMAPVDCVAEQNPMQCKRRENCITRFVWKKIMDSINEVVDSITLQNLVEKCNNYYQQGYYMYYI